MADGFVNVITLVKQAISSDFLRCDKQLCEQPLIVLFIFVVSEYVQERGVWKSECFYAFM